MVDFELELRAHYKRPMRREKLPCLTVNLIFSHDLSRHDYGPINLTKFRYIVFNIQFPSGAEETRVPFNTENFRRALGELQSLSGHAIQYKNSDCVDVKVAAMNCQVHWVASIVEELCAWRKLVLRAPVDRYILWVSASTLENLSPNQVYQTSIANVVQRVAPEIFWRYTYLKFEGAHPWNKSLRQGYISNLSNNANSKHNVTFEIICEHWSKSSEMQMDFPCFRRLLLSVFAIVLKSTYGLHARIAFNFEIIFHICSDCSSLITSVVAHILNILADCHSFLPTNYRPYEKCWTVYLTVERKDYYSVYSWGNLIERHFLNFYVGYTSVTGIDLKIPFPQTTESIDHFPEHVPYTTGGTPRSRFLPEP